LLLVTKIAFHPHTHGRTCEAMASDDGVLDLRNAKKERVHS
jgi:hypothetical protein